MLYIPEQELANGVVVGIDPGSDTLGFATIEFDFETNSIVRVAARTLVGSKLMLKNSWTIEMCGERVARITALKKAVIFLLKEHNPVRVACESSFYNPRRPNAFAVLVEVLTAMKEATRDFSRWRELHLIDPPTVKISVGAKGNADKLVMKEKIVELLRQYYQGDTAIEDLDEHSIDALAVAYCAFKDLIK